MTFYVKNNEQLRDYNDDVTPRGEYHTWICRIESEDPNYNDVWVYHDERYDKEDGWVEGYNATRVGSKPKDFGQDKYTQVRKHLCSHASSVMYLPSDDLIPKKKAKKHIKTDTGFLNITDTEADKVLKDIEGKLHSNFERFKKTVDTGKYTLDDLLFLFYKQGHLDDTPVGCEVSQEDFEKACFLKYIEDCIENPASCGKMNPSDYVRVTYPCLGHECCAFPDRCEDVGGDGENCSMLLNLSKLCGVEEAKNYVVQNDPKMLSDDEIQTLADILGKLKK